jgi:hypothetical protein
MRGGKWYNHILPIKPVNPIERFWPKVNKTGPIPEAHPELGPCWIWTSARFGTGYGSFSLPGGIRIGAHCFSYNIAKGLIPKGLELDHLCRIHHCVNPEHLEPVTRRENTIRGMAPAINAK